MEKLYLIDGMSLVFRAYHAMAGSNLKSPDGEPTSAVFSFINTMTALLEKEKPEHIVVAFDRREPTFRHIKYPKYKANRDAFPEDLVPQLARIKEFLDYASIPQVELAGFEADDIIGTFAKKAGAKGAEVICITSDKDFYQLVDDKIKLYKPQPKSSDSFDIVDIEAVHKKFGVKPEQVIDVLALIGDASDNVPGVLGIGEKTAIPLVQKYGSVENIYEHINEIDRATVKKKFEDNKEMAFLSKELVTISLSVPLEFNINELSLRTPNFAELDNLFRKLGFVQIRKRWQSKIKEIIEHDTKPTPIDVPVLKESDKIEPIDEEIDDIITDETDIDVEVKLDEYIMETDTNSSSLKTIKDIEKEYFLINNAEDFGKMVNELKEVPLLSIDLETSSLNKMECSIVGIALCGKEGRAYYVAVDDTIELTSTKHSITYVPDSLFNVIPEQKEGKQTVKIKDLERIYSNSEKLSTHWALDNLRSILENKETGKCGQNIKFDASILKRYGINLSPVVFDSMIASYLINPDERHNLDILSRRWLEYSPIPITALIGEKKATQTSMVDINPEYISDYACEDADLALKLRNRMEPELIKENLLNLANTIEFPLIEVLVDMENNGVAIDLNIMKDISRQITSEMESLSVKIFAEAGMQFNIDSPKQLGHILFEKMQIPTIKKNKTGFSTDVQVLTELAATFPIAKYVLDYRQFSKLKTTYIESLPKLINPQTNRIHTSFNQTIASTGRLSSTDPNLQNIPIRSEMGREIRKAFVAQIKDGLILSADYSQIEIRIMAYYCKDKQLATAFNEGLDVHSATAATLFEVELDKVDSEMRRIAKTVNFGIMYGLGSFGLAQRLGIGRTEGQNIIDNYFRKYPGIKQYIEDTIKMTQEKGYTETLCGRRRYFPSITSSNRNLRTADERAAINMPIQGTAADMMKLAMIKVHNAMKKNNMKSLMTIQVHDELVFEVHPDEADDLQKLVKYEMENALKLEGIPVVVDTGIGTNWFEAH